MRTVALSIILMLMLLTGLLWWFGTTVGEGLRVPIAADLAAAVPGEGAASRGPAESAAADRATCPGARGLRARLADLMGRSIAFLAAAEDTLTGELDRWPAQLADRDDPEMAYVAAYGSLTRAQGAIEAQEQLRLLEQALAGDPGNPLYLSSRLRLCLEHLDLDGCEVPRIERELAEVDGDNGLSWWLIGVSCTHRGDAPCALSAIARAARAPAYRDYYAERVLLSERVMAAAGLSFPVRSPAAFAHASRDLLIPMGKERDPCRTYAGPQLDRNCLRYGERLESASTSMWTQTVARGLQIQAARRLGLEETGKAVRWRDQRAKESVRDVALGADPRFATGEEAFTARLLWDREVFVEFMDQLRQVGEARAYLDGATAWATSPAECLQALPDASGDT